jgi:hypothetical protein
MTIDYAHFAEDARHWPLQHAIFVRHADPDGAQAQMALLPNPSPRRLQQKSGRVPHVAPVGRQHSRFQ